MYLGECFEDHVDHGGVLVVLPCVCLLRHLFRFRLGFGLDRKRLSLAFHLQKVDKTLFIPFKLQSYNVFVTYILCLNVTIG